MTKKQRRLMDELVRSLVEPTAGHRAPANVTRLADRRQPHGDPLEGLPVANYPDQGIDPSQAIAAEQDEAELGDEVRDDEGEGSQVGDED